MWLNETGMSVTMVSRWTNCALSLLAGALSWFKDPDAAQAFRDNAAAAGGGTSILCGDNWAVECDSANQCESFKSKLGGELG